MEREEGKTANDGERQRKSKQGQPKKEFEEIREKKMKDFKENEWKRVQVIEKLSKGKGGREGQRGKEKDRYIKGDEKWATKLNKRIVIESGNEGGRDAGEE